MKTPEQKKQDIEVIKDGLENDLNLAMARSVMFALSENMDINDMEMAQQECLAAVYTKFKKMVEDRKREFPQFNGDGAVVSETHTH